MSSFAELRQGAIESLKRQGILKDPRIIRAMLLVPREEFLPERVRDYAYVDSPLPIGYGQTTSALHMTALFCEYSEMRTGQRVLEVGAGCGYMSCVYAEVVAPSDKPEHEWGHVWTVEIVPELAKFARMNVDRVGYSKRVSVIQGDASVGLPEFAPYDIIIVTSAAPKIPQPLLDQLQENGTLLIPVGAPSFYQELFRIRKTLNGKIVKENMGGVAFVPLRGRFGWGGE